MGKIRRAKKIAGYVHRGQVDKGGNPYILHPRTVASMVKTENEKTVAWLHDVVEDTDVTLEQLGRYFDKDVIDAVDAITRREDESRNDYLERVKSNDIARSVKLADLKHNSDLSRLALITDKDIARAEKYKEEMRFLQDGNA